MRCTGQTSREYTDGGSSESDVKIMCEKGYSQEERKQQ